MVGDVDIEIEPLRSDHIPAAAAMVTEQTKSLRSRYRRIGLTEPGEVAALLDPLAGSRYSLAAVSSVGLEGFIAAIPAKLWGKPGGYVQDYAFAATRTAVTQTLYIELSARLARDSRFTHAISLWANDDIDVWHQFGFGDAVTEVIKELVPVSAPAIDIRLATEADATAAAQLDHRLHRYLESPPVFLPDAGAPRPEELAERIATGSKPLLIAWIDDNPIGYIALDPEAAESVALGGAEIIHCNGAFVLPEHRNGGVGDALLARATNWSVTAGYTAMALDFETANTLGSAFWAKCGFTPIVYSLRRTFG